MRSGAAARSRRAAFPSGAYRLAPIATDRNPRCANSYYPVLAGQWPKYLVLQLEALRGGPPRRFFPCAPDGPRRPPARAGRDGVTSTHSTLRSRGRPNARRFHDRAGAHSRCALTMVLPSIPKHRRQTRRWSTGIVGERRHALGGSDLELKSAISAAAAPSLHVVRARHAHLPAMLGETAQVRARCSEA